MKKFFQRLWSGESVNVTAGAMIIGFASLASRGVGLIRDRVLAGTFGAGSELDAYYAAFRIPDTMYNLLIAGALTAGFIPVFTTWMEKKGEKEAWNLASRMFSTVLFVLTIACVICFIFAPQLVPLTVPGFSNESIVQVIQLMRIMLISPILLGASAVMGGVLQSMRRFTAFSLAPVLYNVGIIVGTWVLAPSMGIAGVAWGVVLGAFAHALTQWSVAGSLGFRASLIPAFRDEGVREVFRLAAPRAAGLAVTQVNLIILLILASSLPAGSVAVLNFATNVQYLPIGLIGISFAVAAFPALSALWSRDDRDGFSSILEKTTRQMLFWMIPITVFCALLNTEIMQTLLGNGKFDLADIRLSGMVFFTFALSLIPQALVPLYARAFYAMHSTWRPFLIGVVAELVNISVALTLRPYLGVIGLASAFTISAWVQCILFLFFIHQRTAVCWNILLRSLVVHGCASLLMIPFWWFARKEISGSFLLLVVLSALLPLVYLLIAKLFRSEELRWFTEGATRRFMRSVPIEIDSSQNS